VVVVDEAHGASGDSDRHAAVSRLARGAAFVLLLTATPHSGDDQAFNTLCDLGAHGDQLIAFRRSRLEAGRDAGRRIHALGVRATAAEQRMQAALAALTRAVRNEGTDIGRAGWLLLSLLHKRAMSSPYALAESAERRLHVLGEPAGGLAQLLLPLDDDGELDAADSAPMWTEPALRDVGRERRLLEQLIGAAREAQGQEGKLRRLRRLLSRLREPVIVFTEYRDTLLYLRGQVAPNAAMIHGGMSREQRRAALDTFARGGVLLATDAAGEGLNLHQHCRSVINLELPWNPMRLEQRIGRVDRIGQRRQVHVVHLISAASGEARLLTRLSSRIEHASASLATANPLVDRHAWTEEQSARLVVLRDETEPPPTGVPAAERSGRMTLVRLRTEADQESARVALRRQLTSRSLPDAVGRLLAQAPLVATHRRAPLRQALASDALALFRCDVTTDGGRRVATRVFGVRIPWPAADGDRARILDRHEWPFLSSFVASALSVHERRTAIRMARAKTIAAMAIAADAAHAAPQPGLFDQRADRVWQGVQNQLRAARSDADERVAASAAEAHVAASQPELVLLLTPPLPHRPP
jgi:superfamily II DNA or RNA helicase